MTNAITPAPLDMNAVEVRNLFPTPLIIYTLPDGDAVCAALKQTILARRAAHPSVSKSNRDGWQSQDDFFQWAGDAGEAIKQAAVGLITEITRQYIPGEYNLQPFAGPWQINGWANVNTKGSRNEAHIHAGCFWSAVFYVDDGMANANADTVSAPLLLHDPRGAAPIMYAPTLRIGLRGCVSSGAVEAYAPKPGTLVLFPSWLLHSVGEQTHDGERISVAFNFSI